MYHNYWGLRTSPFRPHPRTIEPTSSQHEALARLAYLVEDARTCGAVVGESGTGKTLVLAALARQALREGRKCITLSLLGRSAAEFVGQLAELLAPAVASPNRFWLFSEDVSRIAAWRTIRDALSVSRHTWSGLVIACDDVDEAPAETLSDVLRLVELAATTHAPLTLLAATTPSGISLLPPRLRERCELRVELTAWDADETADFLLAALLAAGARGTIFDPTALLRIFELTGGNPRQVAQLAELALLAGAGQQVASIDEYLIDGVFEELRMPNIQPAI